jgi:hypothetical protein
MSHDEAMIILRQGRGTHFDPDIFDAFLEVEADFRRIAISLSTAKTSRGCPWQRATGRDRVHGRGFASKQIRKALLARQPASVAIDVPATGHHPPRKALMSAPTSRPQRQLHLNINALHSGFLPSASVCRGRPRAFIDVQHYIRARIAERGTLDAIFLADNAAIVDQIDFRPITALEPTVLLASVAAATSTSA